MIITIDTQLLLVPVANRIIPAASRFVPADSGKIAHLYIRYYQFFFVANLIHLMQFDKLNSDPIHYFWHLLIFFIFLQ